MRQHVEFLKAKSEMLRRRVSEQRIFVTIEEHKRLLTLGQAIGASASPKSAQ
jgi:hypothetical protein